VCKRASYAFTSGNRELDDELLEACDEDRLKKIDDYGYDKWRCESLLRRQWQGEHSTGVPFVCLRLPDVLGENEVPSSRHHSYQRRVRRGVPVRIGPSQLTVPPSALPRAYGNDDARGPTTRLLSFVYAADVARAVLLCAAAPAARVHGQSFNIASPEKVTVDEYVRMIASYYAQNPPTGSPVPSAPATACAFVQAGERQDEYFPR
jgi:nucleoside-diphosphate-sugar epimerase